MIDDDSVSNSNLQRQVIYRDADIGMPKVFAAKAAMKAQNPHVTVRPYHRRLTDEIAEALFADYDLILEGSDNFATRYLVNRVAAQLGQAGDRRRDQPVGGPALDLGSGPRARPATNASFPRPRPKGWRRAAPRPG